MADTKETKVKKNPSKTDKPVEKKKKIKGSPRNYELAPGVLRFSRTRMYHKKALWKFIGKKTPKTVRPKKPKTIEKKIGGEKNGGTRVVLLKKRKNHYPTEKKIRKHPSKKFFSQHKRHIRGSLQKGTILILLAGRHKGKRVVLLKTLKSGLLLITGPFKLNSCPLRRISPNYVIATSTQLDLSGVEIPKHLNDRYFRREKKSLKSKQKKDETDIFAAKKETYRPSEQRKADQLALDKAINDVIKQREDKKLMFSYLSRMWGLRSSQYPHRMKF